MIGHKVLAASLRDDLRKCPDMDRSISRLGLDRGGPRDLTAIRDGLAQAGSIAERTKGRDLPEILANAVAALGGHDNLLDLLEQALVADPPVLARDGGFIAPGYHTELDEVRTLRDKGRSVIAGMQKDFVEQTGIAALKIKHNNVLGYFIETTAPMRKRCYRHRYPKLLPSSNHGQCCAIYNPAIIRNGNQDFECGE